tara:strand:- start:9 stop:194 length:186 start_codon:yes stop_codon:yes gene_type:complete
MHEDMKLPPYLVPYQNRKKFCRKIRDTESRINNLKKIGSWKEAAKLQSELRSSWWGYKRYF